MLQSYERELSSVEATLMEMEENLDTTRWVVEGSQRVLRGERGQMVGASWKRRGNLDTTWWAVEG